MNANKTGLFLLPELVHSLVVDNMMYRDTSWTGIMTAIYVTVHPTHVSERHDQRKCVWTPRTVTLCNILRVGLHSGSIERTNFGLLASLVNRTLSFQLTTCVEHHSRNSLVHHCPSRKLKLKRFKLKIPLVGGWVSPFGILSYTHDNVHSCSEPMTEIRANTDLATIDIVYLLIAIQMRSNQHTRKNNRTKWEYTLNGYGP
jgi:hypothetical protein